MQVLSETFEEKLIDVVSNKVDSSLKSIEEKYAIRNQYMKKGDACKYAGISNPTLDSWIVMGLPVHKINGVTRIDRDDVDEFIAKYRI